MTPEDITKLLLIAKCYLSTWTELDVIAEQTNLTVDELSKLTQLVENHFNK